MNKHALWFCLVVLPLMLISQIVLAANAKDFIADFDKTIENISATWDNTGLAVGVIENGDVLLLKGYGLRDRVQNKKITPHTVFQVASVSKTFTATLMAMLAEKNRLSLDDKLVKFMPDLVLGSPEHTKSITLRHVLSHTSGFPHHAGDPRIEGGDDFDTIIKSFDKLKILYAPGKVSDYQNAIFSLSKNVIEKTTHLSFSKSLQHFLFYPLNMTDASVGKTSLRNRQNKALPYLYTPEGHVVRNYSYNYYTVSPAAGINASIADLSQWLKFQMGIPFIDPSSLQPVISQNTLDEIHKPLITTPAETRRMRIYTNRVSQSWYGLGWRVHNYGGHKVVNHGGMLNGMKSLIAFDPLKKTGIVILSNSTSSALGIVRSTFFDALYDLPKVDWNQQFKNQEKLMLEKKAKRNTSKRKTKRK